MVDRADLARKVFGKPKKELDKNWLCEAFSQKATLTSNRTQLLLDRLKKASVFARQIVDQALAGGTEIVFSPELGNIEGVYTQKEQEHSKKIVLNAQMSDERLMSSLVRLARYAQQKGVLDPKMTMHAAVTTARAKAADAKAVEAVAAYEMRFTEPKAYQAFFENNMLIAGCCYYTMRETKNISEALCRTAKSWYDRSIQNFDNNVIDVMFSKGMGDREAFKNNVSVEKLCNIFSYSGCSYMNPDFLSGVKANGISESMASKIERIEKYHKQAFQGKNADKIKTSADNFNVIRTDGTVRSAQRRNSVLDKLSKSVGRY